MLLASLCGCGLTLVACSPIAAYSGFQAIDSKPTELVVGTDTKSTARAKVGWPSVVSTFDPNVWFYISQIKQRVAFRRPQVVKALWHLARRSRPPARAKLRHPFIRAGALRAENGAPPPEAG